MNKKQLGAFLKVVYKGKDRPALTNILIDRIKGRTCLVGTNGVILAAVFVDGLDEWVGRQIARIDLEASYKAMTSRVSDLFGASEVAEIMDNGRNVTTKFPDYMSIITPYLEGEPVGQARMSFNADFFKLVQDINGEGNITVDLHGEIKPMVFKSERGIYIVMPMTLKKPGQAS
jgi:hypothetical protein|nr:MAG TPA: DNA polymerase III subunit beta [Caudoviricetes sp.]